MKKSAIILLGFLMLSVVSAQADLRLGIRGGVNLANASFDSDNLKSDNFTGLQLGALLEFMPANSGLGLEAGALYSQHGFKFKGNDKGEVDIKTLEVPANLKFKMSLLGLVGVYATAGPYISFKLDDSFKDVQDQWKAKSFAAGLNFGFGVEVFKHLQVGANYKMSLTNDYSSIDYKDLDLEGKTRTWSLTATYFF